MMTTQEAIQRGNNLLGVTIVALSGIAFFPEFFLETEASHKFDEAGLFVVGLAGVAWYLIGNNKLRLSLVPLLLVGADLILKIIGLVLERDDMDDVVDDGFFALIFFVGALIVLGWQYASSRRSAARNS